MTPKAKKRGAGAGAAAREAAATRRAETAAAAAALAAKKHYRRGPRELFIVGKGGGTYQGTRHGVSGLVTDGTKAPPGGSCDLMEAMLERLVGASEDSSMETAVPDRTVFPYLFTCGNDLLEGAGCTSWHPMLCADCAVEQGALSPDQVDRIVDQAERDRVNAEVLIKSGVGADLPAAYCMLFGGV